MPDYKDKERLEALRSKLYERGQDANFVSVRHELTRNAPVDVARGWTNIKPAVPVKAPASVETPIVAPLILTPASVSPKKTRRRYRSIIMLASVVIFMAVVGVSSVFLFFGGNQISGKNISFELTGPLTIAGGDVLELQVALNNMNSVAIEGATLIVSYPSGTKSVEENPRDLYQERIPLEDLASGEARTVALKSAVFGEENAEKEVAATIEYRVKGSNGTFYKEATPLKFTINASSLVLRVDSVEKISSGQTFDVKVTLQSNSPTPLKNVLVSAEYPENFTFISSKPEPSYRKNEWFVEDLDAKGTFTVTIKGTASGVIADAFQLKFQAGTPRSDNQYIVGSVLAQTIRTLSVEQPFVVMKISVGGDSDGDVVLSAGTPADVTVTVTNTHSQPIYDMTLRVTPKGTAFNEDRLQATDGFYDSVNKQIRWEVSGMESLGKVLPGERRDFTFRLSGDKDLRTAALDLVANVYARRVNESQVAEELIGTTVGALRFASVATLSRQIDHGTAGLSDTGPVPPTPNKQTTYTLTLVVEAGANDLTGAVVTTKLPQYVEWLKNTTEGTIEFNPVNKEVRWSVGELKGKERRVMSFQVGFTPSILQVDTTPVIMAQQELRATDRFTGSPLTASSPAVTTELSSEAGFERDNGVVVQ